MAIRYTSLWINVCLLPIIALFSRCTHKMRPFPFIKTNGWSTFLHRHKFVKHIITHCRHYHSHALEEKHQWPKCPITIAYSTDQSLSKIFITVYINCVTRSTVTSSANDSLSTHRNGAKNWNIKSTALTQFFCPFNWPKTTLLYDNSDCQMLCRSTVSERFRSA